MGLFGLFGKKKKEEPAPKPKNIRELGVGDIVSYFGQDFEVTAKITWMQSGYRWVEYRMADGDDVRWLSVEIDDGEMIIGFYKLIKEHSIPLPPPDEIEYEGRKFFLEEKGSATGIIESKYGKQQYRCNFWEYESDDEKLLSIEECEGDYEIAVGELAREDEFEIFAIS